MKSSSLSPVVSPPPHVACVFMQRQSIHVQTHTRIYTSTHVYTQAHMYVPVEYRSNRTLHMLMYTYIIHILYIQFFF